MDATAHEKFPNVFWSANVTELFERAAYYSMASFVVIYLGQLGFGAYWPSNLNGILWTLVYFLPILSGTIADQVGFRRSLLVAFVLLAAGYLLMGYPVWFGGADARPGRRRGVHGAGARRGRRGRRDPPHRSGRLGHQAVRLGDRAEDGGRARHPGLRDLLHGDQHRLALRPRHRLRRRRGLRHRHHPRGGRGVRHRGGRAGLPRQQGDGGEGAGAGRPHDDPVPRRDRRRRSSLIAGIVGGAERVETGDSLSYIFAVAACASIAAFFVVLFFYKEPPVAADAPAKPRRSIGRILLDMVLVLRNGRFTLFLVLMSGFFFVYNQVYNVLPLYAKRVVEPSPAMDLYTAANPFVIVCLQLAITQYFGKMKAIRSIVVGTVIIGVSMLINVYPIYAAGGMRAITANWLPLGSVFLILTVALIAFGELFTSARMYEYIGSLAPKGQEGLFLGYANLPLALGSLAGGPGRRVHLQRHHGERRDHAGRRAARAGAGADRPRLERADGRSASCRRSRCGCSTGGSSGSRRRADGAGDGRQREGRGMDKRIGFGLRLAAALIDFGIVAVVGFVAGAADRRPAWRRDWRCARRVGRRRRGRRRSGAWRGRRRVSRRHRRVRRLRLPLQPDRGLHRGVARQDGARAEGRDRRRAPGFGCPLREALGHQVLGHAAGPARRDPGPARPRLWSPRRPASSSSSAASSRSATGARPCTTWARRPRSSGRPTSCPETR